MNRIRHILSRYFSYLTVVLTAGTIGLLFYRKIPFRVMCLVVYVWLLLVFAIIYTSLPGQFYHANVAHEPSVRYEKQQISTRLEEEIKQTFEAELQPVSIGHWRIDSDFHVRSLNTSDQEVSFILDIHLINTMEPNHLYVSPLVKLFLGQSSFFLGVGTERPESSSFLTLYLGTIEMPDTPVEYRDLFSLLPRAIFPLTSEDQQTKQTQNLATNPHNIKVSISAFLQQSFVRLERAVEGDPSMLHGYFSRMFYFSAMTITPFLGTDDVSPLTSTTRSLVLLERLLGIVIIGSLLTTEIYERIPRRKPVTPNTLADHLSRPRDSES
jgi:hypothetical protein